MSSHRQRLAAALACDRFDSRDTFASLAEFRYCKLPAGLLRNGDQVNSANVAQGHIFDLDGFDLE
jgi:hypothetical protein